jgi:outer membrane immunogenic protein
MRNSNLIVSIAAVAISAVLGIGAASAADLPARTYTKAPAIVDPAYNWTGFYVGVNAGYGWSDPTVSFVPNDVNALASTCGGAFGGTCALPMSYDIRGALGGLQAGYNWQMSRWLLGVETDIDAAGIKGSGTNPAFSLGGTPSNFLETQKVDWFGTARARLGFLPTANLLLYGTGGFAYGRVVENTSLNSSAGTNVGTGPFSFFCTTGPNCFVGSSSRIATGWTAGAGFEYAFWKNVSVKAEYLFVNLGNGDRTNVAAAATQAPGDIPSSFTAVHSATEFNVVRLGLNVKLGN